MLDLIEAGGWLMLPIIACSMLALAIIGERLWALRRRRVTPDGLVAQIWHWSQKGELGEERIQWLQQGSPLGRVLAAGLLTRGSSRQVMKESIEETGRHVTHELERFLNTLGTVAVITPLLGLLGTVIGMIEVFNVITEIGVGHPSDLASGISQALVTTAAGISVAVPSLIFHRFFQGRVDELVVDMEQEAIKLVEVMHGERTQAPLAETL